MPNGNRSRPVEVVNKRLSRSWLVQLLLLPIRWTVEIVLLVGALIAYWKLTGWPISLPPWAAICVIVAPIAVLLLIPVIRRPFAAWAWCTITRHRMRSFMVENGVYTRNGRLPLQLLTYPTKVGECTWLLMISGLCVDDIADRKVALASTCWAEDARIDARRSNKALVRVEIIRRDPLDHATPIKSTLLDKKTGVPQSEPATSTAAFGTTTPKPTEWSVGIGVPSQPTPSTTESNTRPRRKTPTTQDQSADAKPRAFSVDGQDVSDFVDI